MTKKLLTNVLLCFAAVLIFSGCCPKIQPTTTYVYKDSTVTSYNYKDTLIYVMKDSVVIDSIKVTVDSSGLVQLKPVKVKSNHAYAKVQIKNSQLTLEGGCDSLELKIKQLTIENTHLKSIDNQVVKVVEKTYIPKFYKFCTYAFILLALVSGVYIYLRIKGLPNW